MDVHLRSDERNISGRSSEIWISDRKIIYFSDDLPQIWSEIDKKSYQHSLLFLSEKLIWDSNQTQIVFHLTNLNIRHKLRSSSIWCNFHKYDRTTTEWRTNISLNRIHKASAWYALCLNNYPSDICIWLDMNNQLYLQLIKIDMSFIISVSWSPKPGVYELT